MSERIYMNSSISTMQTDIELAVEYAKQDSNPMLICQLSSGWLFLALNQVLKGSCFLVAEPFVVQLEDLTVTARQNFVNDMIKVGDSVRAVTGAQKVNYLFLGNKDPVLHVHIIPRYKDEDDEYKAHGPWKYKNYVKFEIERDKSLIAELNAAIQRDSI